MQVGTIKFLKNKLAELNMYQVIELLNNGASKQEIIETFEKNMMYQNKQYQNMLLGRGQDQFNSYQWQQLVNLYKKQQLIHNPKMNLVYQYLQSIDKFVPVNSATSTTKK